jgi:branched-chain amino acid transport system ATP-binding protein
MLWLRNPFMLAPTPSSLLDVQQLSKRFGGLLAVDGVNFSVGAKRITALIGPNGAGKTTVFNCLTGFYRPSGGKLIAHYKGTEVDLGRLAPDQVAERAGLARTFQNIRLFKRLSVLENLLAAQHKKLMQASVFSLAGFLGTKKWKSAQEEAKEKARFWLEKLGILHHANDAAGSLPYGVQRRVEIARALCMDPQLLCLDEPAAGLNPKESAELAQFLQKLRDEDGIGVLLIEHDMSVVMGISDHVVVLDHGQKIAEGRAEDVRNHPDVIKAYLGEDSDA